MNAPIAQLASETDALSGVLRPCAAWPRPIPYPEIATNSRCGGQR
jgi:hypothetical protein